jgi:autotransporter translocation and assembly factor TamB
MSAGESLRIDAHLPRVMIGNSDIRETKANLHNRTSGLGLDVNTYLVQNSGHVNVKLNSEAALDLLNNRLSFNLQQNNTHTNGELLIAAGFLRDGEDRLAANIRIPPARVIFNNKYIDFNDAAIAYSTDRIAISNFRIREGDMLLLGIDGVASKSEADNIRIYFNNTELGNILNAFNVTDFAGSINGDIYVRQALDNPMIRTEELRVENITLRGDTIGTLRIEGDWDNLLSGLNLNAWLEDGDMRSIDIHGYIPTGDSSPFPMDVNLKIAGFELGTVQPLAAGVFSELNGRLNSHIRVTGTLSEPVTEGWLGIDDGMMKVAFTNVTYYVSDTIEVRRDNVGLKDLVIRDQNNRTATLNMSLSHTNFGRMVYRAGIRFNDFMLLNNPNRTDLMAYGQLKLSGELNVTGSPSGIFGKGNLTSTSRSDITVVLPQTATATEYSGIIYVNSKPKESDSLAFLRKNEESQFGSNISVGIPIVIDVTVNLTPLLDAAVVLNPTTGNALEVSGEGELNVTFNSKSTPPVLLYGDYIINNGKFHYNLQNLRRMEFNIREGSRLTMEGNPMNTQFNVTAYRAVRTDLASLSTTFKNELPNTRVPVNAILQIKGSLQGMDLQFDVELPENSNDVQQRVKSFMTNEETKILQVVYLVTFGSFMPSEGSPDMSFGSSMATNIAANTLSKGLDALFANALRDNWSISTNLESVDGSLENVRMGVDVSTRLLNNRLRINTNLSYGDNSMLVEGQQQFLGEFELEYDLKSWLMLRAFNRANQRFYRRTPLTQGVGVMVTREAKRFRDLFDLRPVRKKEED